MIKKIFWAARIAGYAACLAGVVLFLGHRFDADPSARNLGFGLIGAGFVAFAVSYAIFAWLRFGARPTPDDRKRP